VQKIELPYGKGCKIISIPAHVKYDILSAKEPKPITDIAWSFSRSLNNPIASVPFTSLFKSKDKVVIVIPDKTRRCPIDIILNIVIDRLNKNGIRNQFITIIIARGIHSAHTAKEIKKLVGEKIYQHIKIIDHNANNLNNMFPIGITTKGTQLKINKNYVKADKTIIIGSIGYHYFAGFSGGRKLILPGIASYDSIQQNHSLVLNKHPLLGKNPNACAGKLQGNPVNEDMIEASRLAGVDFSINLIMNSTNEITKIFCGDNIKAHEKACEFFNRFYRTNISNKADCVIISAGGYPTDINFIQTHKAIEHASYALKEKGKMLVLSECSEGIGSNIFLDWFKYSSSEEIEKALRQQFIISGHTALCSFLKAKKFNIYLYSTLKTSIIQKLHLNPVASLNKTINNLFTNISSRHKVFIIPYSHFLLPAI
jgi:lactate racemase